MLTDRLTAEYASKGYARAFDVLADDDVEMLRREWARLWSVVEPEHPSVQWRGHVAEGSRADRLDPAFVLSTELEALCRDERLTGLAAAVLGQGALFFKDKLITKTSGTHGYGLHQDWPYWEPFGAPADHLVTLQIAIDPCTAENGALEVWPKAPGVLPPPADDPLDVDPSAVDHHAGELMELDAGDLLLLHPLVPHRSATNCSKGTRRAYFITYVTEQYADAAARLRDAKASAGAASAY